MRAPFSGKQGSSGVCSTLTVAALLVLGPACGSSESDGEASTGGTGAASASGGATSGGASEGGASGGLAGSVSGGTNTGGTTTGGGSGGAPGAGGEGGSSPIRVPQRYLESQPGPGAGMCGCELGEECAMTYSGVGGTEYGCFSIPSECASSFGCEDGCFTPCREGEACTYAPGSGQYRCMGA